ncbi:MAG: aminodeoxychorismate synthase component I [Gammaproteobacteria bacterium]|nr:aminodeoxychorismate synthase component I [Gammaproteobacteria bacterium]
MIDGSVVNNAPSSFQNGLTHITALGFVPDLLALHASDSKQYPHLLSSTAIGASARYDILFSFPGETLCLDHNGLHLSSAKYLNGSGFFEALASLWQAETTDQKNDSDLPFTGGWFVYLSYEMAAEIETALTLPADVSGLPVALATRFQSAVIVDHQKNQAYFVSEAAVDHQHYLQLVKLACEKLQPVELTHISSSFKEEAASIHLKNLEKIHQYIVDGDIFQANLSRLWQVQLEQELSDSELFLLLRLNNPSPFACLSVMPGGSVISSSPERLVSLKGKQVDTRPIAGTRPRVADENKDQLLCNELLSNPKERAEHIMLLDLERNDLGRVCEPGSITVDELMSIESYQHVHHIVSNVTGRVRPGISPVDIIKAVFPGGTITGCPKVRCMQILAELEATGRGAYTGSIGYINRNGDMDMNILIRTLVKTGQHISFRAGGGIVADSEPLHELAETRAKAKGMINALSNALSAGQSGQAHR